MSSNTNIGNTPVNQGYVQLIHTGETGGIDGTLRTLYDGDGTASDLQIASNKVKISTQLYIGSKTITEYVQDVVGDMFDTNGSHTNITATYDDDGDGAIDLVATGAISGLTEGTGVTITGATNKTIAIGQSVGTSDTVSFGRVNLGSTDTSSFLTGDPKISATGYMMIQGIINETETGSTPSAIVFGNNSTYGNDEISLITNGQNRLYINSVGDIYISQDLIISGDLQVNGTTTTINQTNLDVSDNIIGLNRGLTGASANDSGLIIERGTTGDNVFIGYDESLGTSGRVRFATTTALPNATGALSFSGDANVHAGRFYGDVTGNVTGSASLNLLISNNLSDLTSASTARSNLGVDAAGTDNSTPVTLAGARNYITASGTDNQTLTLGQIDISDDTNLVGGTGITLTGDTLSTTDSEIVHDNLNGYVENEHKDHSAINITAGAGLSGGGNITASRQLALDISSLDAQTPALTLSDKVAIYDTDVSENNVATLTQLKAIVNTDTNTNQLTTFDVSGDSGTDQTISHGNTLTISGGNGITTSTSATDILSVALGGFSALTLESSPAEQDLLVLEDEIDGTIKKVQVASLTSGISFNGSTANGLLTYGNSSTADVEANLTFDGDFKVTGNDSTFETVNFDGSNGYLMLSGTATQRMEFRNTTTNAHGWIGIPSWNTDSWAFYAPTASSNELAYTYESSRHNLYNDVALQATKKLYLDGGTHTYIQEESDGNVVFYADNRQMLRLHEGNGEVVINDPGLDTNFRVEGDTYTDLFFVDAGTDRVGIGTTSPGALLDVVGTGYIRTAVFSDAFKPYSGTLATYGSNSSTDHYFVGDVGIGTTSPGSKLHIQEATAGTAASTFQSALKGGLILEDDSTPTANNILIKSHGVGDGNAIGGIKFVSSPDGSNYSWAGIQGLVSTFNAAGQLAFYTAANNTAGATSTERMRIDESGNVGIGTDAPNTLLHLYSTSNTQLRLQTTGTNNASNVIYQNGSASYSVGINSAEQFSFYSSQLSGDAGFINTNGWLYWYNPILLTTNNTALKGRDSGGNVRDMLKIDANDDLVIGDSNLNDVYINQNVGIAVSSPAYKLDVNGSIRNYANGSAVFRTESTAAGYGAYNKLITTTNTYDVYALNGDFIIDESGVATRLTIKDSTGSVLIGTTNTGWDGDADNLVVGSGSGNNGMTIYAGSTSFSQINFADSNSGAGRYTGLIRYLHSIDAMSFYTNGGTEALRIDSSQDAHFDQDVIAFSTTPSDKRLKKNIKDIDYGLDTIMKLNPKEYDWKKDDRHDIGFIAQEVEEVIPEIVKDKKHFDKEIKTLDYEKLTAVLIKAVQEQQQQINKLEDKLNG